MADDELEVIQLPANVFDRRAVDSGLWERARRAGKRVFVRSVYFQGMALADAAEVRARAPDAAEMIEAYARFCELHGLDRRRFAVDYVRNRLPGAVLVIGAETAATGSRELRTGCRARVRSRSVRRVGSGVAGARRVSGRPSAAVRSVRLEGGVTRIPVIIQARMGSSRLPGKSLLLLHEQPVLRWVVDRGREIPGTSGVVVATSTDRQDDPIARYCDRHEIPAFRGSASDVLDRFVACARERRADAVVRITADCPLLDPEQSGRVVAAFREATDASYASNISPRTVPDGLDTEVIRFSALEAAWREATDPCDREHVSTFVRRQPERFEAVSPPGEAIATDRRLTLDTIADFVVLSAIADRLRARRLEGSLLDVLSVIDEPRLDRQAR